jgi:hypothetical protein
MNAKTLYALIAAAVVALLAAWWINSSHAPVNESAEQSKALLPGLRERLNDITAITLTGADNQVVATLEHGSNGWSIEQKSGYPADVPKYASFCSSLPTQPCSNRRRQSQALRRPRVEDVKGRTRRAFSSASTDSRSRSS